MTIAVLSLAKEITLDDIIFLVMFFGIVIVFGVLFILQRKEKGGS